nr:reverse transcriptase domain-containing protein [Tanacetum cinerariifolium]
MILDVAEKVEKARSEMIIISSDDDDDDEKLQVANTGKRRNAYLALEHIWQRPTTPIPSKVANQRTEVTKDQGQTSNPHSTSPVQPTLTQSEPETSISEPVAAPVSAPMPNLKPSIPYPSRRDNERRRDQANEEIEKFYEIFKEMSFEISFTDALMLIPKFASTLKA